MHHSSRLCNISCRLSNHSKLSICILHWQSLNIEFSLKRRSAIEVIWYLECLHTPYSFWVMHWRKKKKKNRSAFSRTIFLTLKKVSRNLGVLFTIEFCVKTVYITVLWLSWSSLYTLLIFTVMLMCYPLRRNSALKWLLFYPELMSMSRRSLPHAMIWPFLGVNITVNIQVKA